MKKTKTRRLQRHDWSNHNRRTYAVMGGICSILLLAFGAVAGPWSPLPDSRMRVAFLSLSAPLPSPQNPSKEYIYAGSRLVATEEPIPLAAPLNVEADTFSNARIDISWNAAANAHHYVVERATQSGVFTPLNSNVTSTTYNDTSVTNLNAYLYRVRSADAAGNLSSASNVDLATAITFTDDPFPAPPTETLVRADHILQLRQAINAVRHLIPVLTDFDWDQDSLIAGVTLIKAKDVEELRTALDEALLILGMPTGGYTDSSLIGKSFQKQYITELRDRVK